MAGRILSGPRRPPSHPHTPIPYKYRGVSKGFLSENHGISLNNMQLARLMKNDYKSELQLEERSIQLARNKVLWYGQNSLQKKNVDGKLHKFVCIGGGRAPTFYVECSHTCTGIIAFCSGELYHLKMTASVPPISHLFFFCKGDLTLL